jgi:hypothetical protein
MQNFSKILKVLGVLAAIVAVGIAIGWVATRGTGGNVPSPKIDPTVQTPLTNPPIVRTTGHPIPLTTNGQTIAENPGHPTGILPPNTTVITNWEDKLDDILGSETDDTNKVKELFQMFPRLPEDGQVEIAQHLSNLVEDEDYAPLGKLLENAKLSEDVLDILMADVLNRPNAIKLPMFLELAKNPEHAKAEEAKDLLELYLDEDYKDNWELWRTKMNEWLKENPD